MRPLLWNPPIELSTKEEKSSETDTQSQIICVLRQIRHALFDGISELATVFKDSTVVMSSSTRTTSTDNHSASIYGVSDDEAMEAIEMDRRWQLVLDCLDCEQPLWERNTGKISCPLMSKSFDRRLIEKTIEIAQRQGGYNSRSLRVALDSSPLWGAARIEDTYNLLGHALRKALEVIAQNEQRDLASVAEVQGQKS